MAATTDETDPAPPDQRDADGAETATATRRPSKWDRPPARRDWRYVVGTVGRVLIATGLLLFGFVAYQLWGTGLETARAQSRLEDEFDELLAGTATTATPTTAATTTTPTSTPTTTPPSTEPGATTTAPPATTTTVPRGVEQTLPPIAIGDPIARIEIPVIGVDDIVVAGIGVDELKKGPGHFPETPIPGQLGNAAIAGHRTTYGQPFFDVDELVTGDEIVVTTLAGRFVYRVTNTEIVSPSDYQVVTTTDPDVAGITLVSCHPAYSAAQRIIIRGVLDESVSDPVGLPSSYLTPGGTVTTPGLPGEEAATTTPATAAAATTAPATTGPATTEPAATEPPTTEPATTMPATTAPAAVDDEVAPPAVSEATEDAFARGWFSDDGAPAQVALWGTLVTLIAIGAYLLSRRTRHDLVGLAAGVVPFSLALFFFFQNVNRLLPPGL